MGNVFSANKIGGKKYRGVKPVTFIALTFLFLIAVGTILLMLPISHKSGEFFSFTNAFFTSVSAVCVTGLVVVNTFLEFTMFGQVVIIILIQLGGLGLMTMATLIFIIAGKRITLKERLILQEAYNRTDLQGLVSLTMKIAKYTFVIEGVGAGILTLAFLPKFTFFDALWRGVFHSISAFCNAGFDILGQNSFVEINSNPLILLTIIALVVLGGIGFCVITDFMQKGKEKRRLSLHARIVLALTATLIALGTVLFLAFEWNNPKTIGNMNFFHKLLNAAFQSVTTRTAGFDSIGQNGLTAASTALSNTLMFIGASPSGTGGGIKTTTFLLLIVMFVAGASGKESIVAFRHTVRIKQALRAFSITLMGLVVVFLASIFIYILEFGNGTTYSPILFECFSAFGTVGLSQGITADLSPLSLYILSFTMYIGRLGSLFLGLFFVGKATSSPVHYSDLKIIIG